MTETKNELPTKIRRPLTVAAFGIGGFLAAFAIWAIFAPLATTITLRGSIASSTPSFALQHPYGGMVREVLVEPHMPVEEGQVLMRLETSLERAALETQNSAKARIEAENEAIDAILAHAPGDAPFEDAVRESPHFLRQQHVVRQTEAKLDSVKILSEQVLALKDKISHAEEQLALMSGRSSRQGDLTRQGLLRRSENEQLREQMLIVRGEIDSDRASILELQNQITQTIQQIEIDRLALSYELSAAKQRNLEKLDATHRSIIDMSDRIEKSEVRAPIAGIITSVPVEAERMFAERGATLVTLSRPLENAQVSFSIPADYIDQIHPGMSARLVIPSLPQRQMPKIDLEISTVSPRATNDENGNPVAFEGVAVAEAQLLEQIDARFEPGTLSEDMPVVLMVSVRETTFANYLVAPFLSAFSRALQD